MGIGTATQVTLVSILVLAVVACATAGRPASYGAELTLCNETAKTLEESIDCENRARMREHRPLRPVPVRARDGGAP